MSAYVWWELGVSNRANCSQKQQIMPKNTQNNPLSIPGKRRAATCHVCNRIWFFYAFLNIMGYVSGRIPDQRSHKIKNSVPSKKLDFTLFFASVKGFEPPGLSLRSLSGARLHRTTLFAKLFIFRKKAVFIICRFRFILYYFVHPRTSGLHIFCHYSE